MCVSMCVVVLGPRKTWVHCRFSHAIYEEKKKKMVQKKAPEKNSQDQSLGLVGQALRDQQLQHSKNLATVETVDTVGSVGSVGSVGTPAFCSVRALNQLAPDAPQVTPSCSLQL